MTALLRGITGQRVHAAGATGDGVGARLAGRCREGKDAAGIVVADGGSLTNTSCLYHTPFTHAHEACAHAISTLLKF